MPKEYGRKELLSNDFGYNALAPTPLPKITCKGTRIIRRPINLETDTLIDEEYYGDEDDILPTIRLVNVALAKFYYHPDVAVDSHIRVKAHIEFRDPFGEVARDVNDALWFGHEDEYVEFSTAESHELIVAIIPEDKEGIVSYEYGLKSYEDYAGKFFSPELERIEGKEFRANVQLICKRGTEYRTSIPSSFNLKLEPEVKFEEFKPTEAKASESQAKRDYKIEQLKHYIHQLEEAESIPFDRMERLQRFVDKTHVEAFVKEYFDESHVQRFNEKPLIALREFLKELLE